MATTGAQGERDARTAMNRMYAATRHVYDATRKYYLLGRDALIEGLGAAPGMRVCEVGCGTARNLIKIARRWPGAVLSGVDASDEMLKTARANLARAGLSGAITVEQGLAQDFAPPQNCAPPARRGGRVGAGLPPLAKGGSTGPHRVLLRPIHHPAVARVA